jgi:hypothetical protein
MKIKVYENTTNFSIDGINVEVVIRSVDRNIVEKIDNQVRAHSTGGCSGVQNIEEVEVFTKVGGSTPLTEEESLLADRLIAEELADFPPYGGG